MFLSTSSKKKDNKLAKKMESYDKRIVEKLMKTYLERCMFIHSLAFFVYRLSLPDQDTDQIIEILEGRRAWMIKTLKKIEQLNLELR